jgi:hypothetical protein
MPDTITMCEQTSEDDDSHVKIEMDLLDYRDNYFRPMSTLI